MVYDHEPYDDIPLSLTEWNRRFWELEFPDLNRHEVFDDLISACWHNVYPTMALVAYDFKRKTKDIASIIEYENIDYAKERKTCEALLRRGILGPDLARRFQSFWQIYTGRSTVIWQILVGLPQRILRCLWS